MQGQSVGPYAYSLCTNSSLAVVLCMHLCIIKDVANTLHISAHTALHEQVSAQLLALLSTYAANGQCEKTSYDDFYLEVHATSSAITSQQDCSLPTDGAVHVVGDSSFAALPAVLQQAVQVLFAECTFCCFSTCLVLCNGSFLQQVSQTLVMLYRPCHTSDRHTTSSLCLTCTACHAATWCALHVMLRPGVHCISL